jgi:hypothetical protein
LKISPTKTTRQEESPEKTATKQENTIKKKHKKQLENN